MCNLLLFIASKLIFEIFHAIDVYMYALCIITTCTKPRLHTDNNMLRVLKKNYGSFNF